MMYPYLGRNKQTQVPVQTTLAQLLDCSFQLSTAMLSLIWFLSA